ncbi:MAG: insulinase family protein [Verrucomicrobia bacterium]|nr:insulinase family protein [Verrucomicrobiota bacterium]
MARAAYYFSTLPNGLRIATAEMPQMESVAVGHWAAVGSRHEPARLHGAAHFLEHMLFKGTARRSARAISRAVEGLGGELNAFTSEDHTCYYAKAGAEHLDAVGDVLADLYRHSRLAPTEIARERGVIAEEIRAVADQPAQLIEDLLAATVWPRHPLGRALSGTLESVAALRREGLVDFWRGGYHARSTVLTVAGRVEHATVVKTLGRRLATLPAGPTPRFQRWPNARRATDGERGFNVCIERRESEQTQLALGFPAPGRQDERRFAVRLLSTILGENMGSRLFQSLRERRGLCYSVQSAADALVETGMFSIGLGLEAENVRAALTLIRQELGRLMEKAVGRKELRQAQDYLVGQHRLSLESTTNQMSWLGESILGHGRVVAPEDVRGALERVTPAEVQAAARGCFSDGAPVAGFCGGCRALVVVGPCAATEAELRRWAGGW